MNSPRSLEFAPPDVPLREDVRRLGTLVGDMLAEQVSPEFLAHVERVRTTAIAIDQMTITITDPRRGRWLGTRCFTILAYLFPPP